MNRFSPVVAGLVLLSVAPPLHAQKQKLPAGKALLQSAYATYDTPKTMRIRVRMLTKDGAGNATNIEMTASVENDSAGKMTRGLLTMKDTSATAAGGARNSEQRLLNVGGESYVILPKEKKYAPRERQSQRFSDFFRSMIGSFVDDKTTYSVAEAKANGVPVYQITTSVTNGTRARITIEKQTRLFQRVTVTAGGKDTVADIKVESQQRNVPIPAETFAKPGADYTLDPAITQPAPAAPTPPDTPAPDAPAAPPETPTAPPL